MKRANINRAREITEELNLLDQRLSVLDKVEVYEYRFTVRGRPSVYHFEIDEGMRPVIIELIRQKLLKRHAELSAELETL